MRNANVKVIKALAVWTLTAREEAPHITPEVAMLVAKNEAHFGWYLPTEVVMHNPQTPVVMDRVSYYSVWADDVRAVMGYTLEQWPDMIEKPDAGYRYANQAYLVEKWVDRGDDGHTRYIKRGYALIRAEDFDALKTGYYEIEAPTRYCYSCDTTSPTESWVPGAPGGYARCPNCTAC